MEIETKTVLVPIGGLVVNLDEGRFTKWHSIHPETAAPNTVKVTESGMRSFKLQVLFHPPAERKRVIRVMKDEEGNDCRIPDFSLVHPVAVPVEAEVIYRITGE